MRSATLHPRPPPPKQWRARRRVTPSRTLISTPTPTPIPPAKWAGDPHPGAADQFPILSRVGAVLTERVHRTLAQNPLHWPSPPQWLRSQIRVVGGQRPRRRLREKRALLLRLSVLPREHAQHGQHRCIRPCQRARARQPALPLQICAAHGGPDVARE